mmetsp:Transcript_15541/g.27606  ORF Transcript_15541/g.27606 Transcript_15541/m.27606 type:complete len:162 (+) Transcript_15541:99-584(+)|eukprot:CAMPEP_0184519968 /NCGR_PEP_ID=MMETSP0198_2-20121128/6911_1 /TAXON_ID=1112570 /ORGANISM="Thraustochytrium sp., Strain LLF1b" /LENGTH=161 /DNA_ID=CAMNT_0026910523 /DNA_START=59 /DNA_END=544 /DNA_ORIENTATION=-
MTDIAPIDDTPEGALKHVVECRLACPPEQAFELFVEVVWKQGGFQSMPWPLSKLKAKIVAEGEENGVGSTRVIPSIVPAVVEEVVRSEKGKEIEYRVRRGMPLKYHRGNVVFEPVDEGATKVVWTVTYIAMTGAGHLFRAQLKTLSTFLRSLEQAVALKTT